MTQRIGPYALTKAEKRARYYERHRDEILARGRAKYREDPRIRQRIVATNRKRRRLERMADRWLRDLAKVGRVREGER